MIFDCVFVFGIVMIFEKLVVDKFLVVVVVSVYFFSDFFGYWLSFFEGCWDVLIFFFVVVGNIVSCSFWYIDESCY